jgi:hypothetical protein
LSQRAIAETGETLHVPLLERLETELKKMRSGRDGVIANLEGELPACSSASADPSELTSRPPLWLLTLGNC